ncbi:MAG: extracellular solute-binding protein [Thiopseudomonas sp.]
MPRFFALLCLSLALPAQAAVTLSHGFARFGRLLYPASFRHFDWVNPDAPQGGQLHLMALGTFDSLNPYILKGTSPIGTGDFYQYGVSELNAPLMVGHGVFDPSGDEAASAYGLVAESIQYADDLRWVVFNLRPQARFHDGQPITASDVEFSWRTLLEHGHPQYRNILKDVERVEILAPLRVRFVFRQPASRQQILSLGELPVLPAHWWQQRDFSQTSFEPPLGSGPYRITAVKPGRSLRFERVANWWGNDLPVNVGKYNIQRIDVDFYRDRHVAFEAFKAGNFDLYIEHQAKNWATGYRFPALERGELIRAEIPHQIPAPLQALFFNTRRAPFDNPQVREALAILFDFEWTNRSLFNSAYQRTTSYFPNSPFASRDIPQGAEWLLLKPWRQQLADSFFQQPFQVPVTDGRGISRDSLGRALGLLQQAGWKLRQQGLHNSQGQPLALEILLVNPGMERILQSYVQTLRRTGINARLRTVDRAQFKQRLDAFDYDMTLLVLPQSLNPGPEQWLYFHSSQAAVRGSKNYAGIQDPMVDALLEAASRARTENQLQAAMQALDRTLLWQHYIVPNWYISQHRIAYSTRLKHPQIPPYTLGLRAWWLDSAETP